MNLKCNGETMSSVSKSLSTQGGEALKPAFIEEGRKDPRVESHSKLALQQIEKANIPRDQNAGKQRNAATPNTSPVQIEADKIPPQETLEQILEKMPEDERETFVRLSQIIRDVKDFKGFTSWKGYIDHLINNSIIKEGNTEKAKLSRTNLRSLYGAIYNSLKPEPKGESIELALLRVSPQNRKELLEKTVKTEQPHNLNESKEKLTPLPTQSSDISSDRSREDHGRITNYEVFHPISNGHASQQMIPDWRIYNAKTHQRINEKMRTNEGGYGGYFFQAQEILPGVYLGSALVGQNVMKPGSVLGDVHKKSIWSNFRSLFTSNENLPRPAAVRCLDINDAGDRKYGFFDLEDDNALLIQVRDVPQRNDASVFRGEFEKAFTFIDTQVNAGNQVLIHCRAGQSRSATLLAAYIMKKTGCTAAEALNWIATKRPIIYPQQPFLDLLHAYELELKK